MRLTVEMPSEQTLPCNSLLAPPEHSHRAAKHIGTSCTHNWNTRSVPSLLVNCCVENGPRTTSLSARFRSAAYRHMHSRGRVGRDAGLQCQSSVRMTSPSSLPLKQQLDRRLAPGPATWLTLLLADVGLCGSAHALLGRMLAGLAQQPPLALQETSAPEVSALTLSFSPSIASV